MDPLAPSAPLALLSDIDDHGQSLGVYSARPRLRPGGACLDIWAGRKVYTMTNCQPELWVEGAAAGVKFYEAAFGAVTLHSTGQGDDIVAQLAVGDACFWVAQANQAMGRLSPLSAGGATGRTLLVADDPDTLWAQAVGAGARGISVVNEEHGWRVGRVVDPYGHEWEIGRPVEDWPTPKAIRSPRAQAGEGDEE